MKRYNGRKLKNELNSIAKFEKVSFDTFRDNMRFYGLYTYETLKLPSRSTQGSVGYDFYYPYDDITLLPGETISVYTGVRCMIDDGYGLFIFPRSSYGINYKIKLDNTIGVIDPDYYYSNNEGVIIVSLTNTGDKNMEIHKGDKFCQGVFLAVGLAEEDDTITLDKRNGGIGSTGK